MSNPYEIIYNAQFNFDDRYKAAIGKLTEFEIKATPGWKVMNQDPIPRTPEEVFKKFVREIHPVGKWCGGSSAAFRLLGGVSYEGECALFANCFRTLLTAPKPFGLQMDKSQSEVVPWKGLYGKGFVVGHPKVIMGLPANVEREQTASSVDSPALHLWDNHKVVTYNNLLWDACYGCTWASDREAVFFDICKVEETKGGEVYTCEPTNLANSIKVAGKNLAPTQVVFFKQISVSPRVCHQGPLLRLS